MAQGHRIRLAGAAEGGDPASARDGSRSREETRSGFVLLDALCTNASASGLHRLAAAPHVARAALQHLARRLRAQGRPVLYGERTPARPAFADLLERNGLGPATDSRSVLRALESQRHCVFLLAGVDRDSWDATVLDELEADLIVVSGTHEARATETIALQETLTPEGRTLWLDGMCAELEASAPADLASLDSWLARTVHVAHAVSLGDHHECASDSLATLAAVGRPLPRAVVEQYLGEHTASECLAHGVREDESGLFFSASAPADAAASRRAADLLQRTFPADAWALTRAACLHLQHGDAPAAMVAFQSALSAAHDPAARREVLSVLDTNLAAVAEPGRAAFVLEAVARALELSESAFALRWLRSITPDQCDSRAQRALLQGRALYATGDMVAAKVSLDEARTNDANEQGQLGAAIAAELAELACARGDHALARAEADAVLGDSRASLELRLRARNVTGKILLARSEWEEADRHFAEDALLASNHGLGTAEMRADLNRGIALLSRGRIDDADRQFVRVLATADSRQDALAAAYALPNLAVAAVRKHEYGRALELWERAAKTLQRLQSRLPALRAMVSTNLAEMRIRLGLFDQAAHVIAFARRGAGTSELPSVSTWLDITEATLYLRRGDTSTARRLATHSLVEANRVGERHRAHLALRTLARIALEDGDVQTAEHLVEVECATADATPSDAGLAEISVLRAALARAQGRDDALDLAEACLQPLREAGDEELLIEGLTLVALGYRDRGQEGLARESALRAAMVRDRVAETLQGETRGSYIAKRENTAVQRLLGSLDQPIAEPAPSLPGSRVRPQDGPRALCGDTPQISSLLASIRKVAKSTATVLVRGESGTGKELVAAALHAQSDRASGPLVTVNCSALVETLLLSELFGHEKGSFTGAAARRRGRFELAEGGTLFLDEIGDISPRTQVALLRVLQERTFERVGGTTSIQANVRVVCATHRNLVAMVERGEFREDLYYRLCGVVLEVPALRNRLGDLPELSRHLLERVALERGEPVRTLSRDALELMARHKWPGNVRELENVLRSLALFAEGNVITSSDLVTNHECFAELASQRRSLPPPPPPTAPSQIDEAPSSQLMDDDDGPMSSIGLPLSLGSEDPSSATEAAYAHVRGGKVSLFDLKRQIERDCILLALKETGGNITHAAALLSMKRPRLSQLVKQYQLQSEESS